MNQTGTDEFKQHLDEFRQEHLLRLVRFLAVAIWLLGVLLLFARFSGAALALLISFEALCWLTLRLADGRRFNIARHLFVGGLTAWSLALVWAGQSRDLLFAPILIGPLIVALLEPRQAAPYAAALLVGLTALSRALTPGALFPIVLPPLLAALAFALALIGNINVVTILGWAETSISQAADRLSEVREHRAAMQRNVKALNDAVQRLERANQMLTEARAEAEEARQARNQFALTVSHELRSPLNFIIGFSELMVNAPETYGDAAWPPGLYADIQAIYKSSNHLLHLVNDILDLGRADAQRLMLVKERVAPAQIVEDAAAIVGPGVASRGLYLRIEAEEGLPDLFVDRTRIRQVLINLLNNALRFTEQGGMTIRAGRCKEGVRFEVEDTGPGIPPEGVAKVFEEFGQVNTTVWRRRDGSGLGVPISQRFVAMHGGRLWLTSAPGHGTTFYFTLPLPGMAESASPPTGRPGDLRWALGGRPAPQLVALLARDPAAAEALASYLEGYRVVGVATATEALHCVARQLPQALVIDAALAGQPEIGPLLDALPYDLPVLTLALPGQAARFEALPVGVTDYLVKPVLRNALSAALDRLGRSVRRLLVIDDDPEMARYIGLALSAGGGAGVPEIESAESGGEALAVLRDAAGSGHLPDAIMLDLTLPDMSGWAVLSNLQAHPELRELPVILITAMNAPEELELRTRRPLQLSTRRQLDADELAAVLTGVLGAIRPRFPAGADAPALPEDPSA